MSRTKMRDWEGRLFSVASLLLLCGAAGCKGFFPPLDGSTGGGGTVVNSGNYAYVINNVADTISGFSIGSTGTLAALTGFPVTLTAGFIPTAAVVTPSNAFLYVAGAGVIYGYTISSSGALTPIKSVTGSTALVNVNIVSMDVSPDGNWLIALDAYPAIPIIDYYKIGATGQLAVEPTVQYSLTGGATIIPNSIRVSPKGDYVAIALGTAGDVIYSFNTSAASANFSSPIQIDTGSSSAADQALVFDATESTVYIARSGTGVGVYPFTIGSSNGESTLTQVAGAPFLLGPTTTTFGPSSMVIDATGAYLYVGNKSASSISGFLIGNGGGLTPLSGSPFTAGSNIDALARDKSGKFIMAANLNGNPADVSLFGFDATVAGTLSAATTASTGNPSEPGGAVALALTH